MIQNNNFQSNIFSEYCFSMKIFLILSDIVKAPGVNRLIQDYWVYIMDGRQVCWLHHSFPSGTKMFLTVSLEFRTVLQNI